jgi:hypothetical protein
MQLRIDIRTLSICSSDRLVCLRRLSSVTPASSMSICGGHSHFRRLSDVILNPFRLLFLLTDCDRSCNRSGTFSGVHWQGRQHLRQGPMLNHPFAFGALLLLSCRCGFCTLFIAIAILGKSTHPPLPDLRLPAPHVELRHNFGSGYDFPISRLTTRFTRSA